MMFANAFGWTFQRIWCRKIRLPQQSKSAEKNYFVSDRDKKKERKRVRERERGIERKEMITDTKRIEFAIGNDKCYRLWKT